MCQMGEQPQYRGDCFRGVVMTIVNNRGTDQAFMFCLRIPEQFKADCYDGLGKWIRMLHVATEARAAECSKAENAQYFETCMKDDLETISYHSI